MKLVGSDLTGWLMCRCSPIMSEPAILSDKGILKRVYFRVYPSRIMEDFADHRHQWRGFHEGGVQFVTAREGKKLGE